MKTKIEEILLKHLNDGFAKIIFGPAGAGKTSFLFDYFKYKLENNGYVVVCFVDQKEDEIFEKLSNISQLTDSSKYVILVKNIFRFLNYDKIINSCVTSKKIELICTSDINYPILNAERMTFIRGRIYSIFYPSTMYEEFIQQFGKNLNSYLFTHELNLEIFENINSLRPSDLEIYRKLLTHYRVPASIHSLSSQLKNRYSQFEIDKVYKNLKRKYLFYELNRYDIKTDSVISTGKLIYPIDTRFYYLFDNKSYKINYKKYVTAATVAKLFYDNYKVYKAVYVTQKKLRDSSVIFSRNTDAGLLAYNENNRFLIFVEPYLTDEIIDNIKKIPSNLFKVVITFEKRGGPETDINGLCYCSIEYFLEKGLFNYGRTGNSN